MLAYKRINAVAVKEAGREWNDLAGSVEGGEDREGEEACSEACELRSHPGLMCTRMEIWCREK